MHKRSRLMVTPEIMPTTTLGYLTVKGWMYPAVGATWTMRYNLSSIDFNAPRKPDASCIPSLIRGLEFEVAHLVDSQLPVSLLLHCFYLTHSQVHQNDFYGWGGKARSASHPVSYVITHPVITDCRYLASGVSMKTEHTSNIAA